MFNLTTLYALAGVLGIVGGIGVINSEIQKITSGIQLFGVLGIIILLFPRYSGWHVIGLIVVSLVFSFISFSIIYRRKK